MKRVKAFIWGIIHFCTKDGFFRILEKTSFQLICTQLYLTYYQVITLPLKAVQPQAAQKQASVNLRTWRKPPTTKVVSFDRWWARLLALYICTHFGSPWAIRKKSCIWVIGESLANRPFAREEAGMRTFLDGNSTSLFRQAKPSMSSWIGTLIHFLSFKA